jgi:hypothetical protein
MNRRSFIRTSALCLGSPLLPAVRTSPRRSARPVTIPARLAARGARHVPPLRREHVHQPRVWSDGRGDPAIFDPSYLDARQWAQVARRAGFRAMWDETPRCSRSERPSPGPWCVQIGSMRMISTSGPAIWIPARSLRTFAIITTRRFSRWSCAGRPPIGS